MCTCFCTDFNSINICHVTGLISAELESLQNLVQQAGRKLKAANEELRETTRKKAEALELLEREIRFTVCSYNVELA